MTDITAKAYKAFIKRFHSLHDCSFFWMDGHEQRDRFTNEELATFRNAPRLPFITEELDAKNKFKKIYRSRYTPSLIDLDHHRHDLCKKSSIWISNESNQPVLMMLIDIDSKDGTGDVDGAADLVSRRYFNGKTYTEQSAGQKGRHVYFFVDAQFAPRAALNDALKAYGRIIRADPDFTSFGVTFDYVPIYGLPTLWKRDSSNAWKVAYRGNQCKLPYLPNGSSDLDRMTSLSDHPLSGAAMIKWHQSKKAPISLAPHLPSLPVYRCSAEQVGDGIEHQNSPEPDNPPTPSAFLASSLPVYRCSADKSDGPSRRAKLYRQMVLANPSVTEDEFAAAYAILTPNNGGEEKVRADFQKMKRTFVIKASGNAAAFNRQKYLEQAKMVPILALRTPKGRTKIDHQRLADFLAVKVQDAFQNNGYRAIAGREATLKNWQALYQKGAVNWMLTANAYTFLIKVCRQYDLLEVIEEYVAPHYAAGKKQGGLTRTIGPGPALKDEFQRFAPIAAEIRSNLATDKRLSA